MLVHTKRIHHYFTLKPIFVGNLRLVICTLCHFNAIYCSCKNMVLATSHMSHGDVTTNKEEGKCRPVERGSSHSSSHQVVSVSMSELFLSWLPFWSSWSSQREKTLLPVEDCLSQNWTQTLIRTCGRSRRIQALWIHPLLNPIPPHQRQNMTNYWWVEKKVPSCMFCSLESDHSALSSHHHV